MGRRLDKWKQLAREMKRNLFVLYMAYKDPRVPAYAKWFAMAVVAYAFSPIDLIPDFIPILGYLDDIILVPWGIALALKMIPSHVIDDCREKAEELRKNGKPKNWLVAALFIVIWLAAGLWLGRVAYHLIR